MSERPYPGDREMASKPDIIALKLRLLSIELPTYTL